MKRFLFLFWLTTLSAFSVPITFTWDPYPHDENVVDEFVLYETLPEGDDVIAARVNVPATRITVDVVPGVHVYYLIARNYWGDSPPSNTVTTPPAMPIPSAPKGLRIALIVYPSGSVKVIVASPAWTKTEVSASNDLDQWELICSRVNVTGTFEFIDNTAIGRSQRFYRAIATQL